MVVFAVLSAPTATLACVLYAESAPQLKLERRIELADGRLGRPNG